MDRDLLRRGALLLLLLLAFALRIAGLTAQSFWRDEVDALRFSAAPLSTLFANFTRPGWNGPLFYVLLRYWLALVGRTEFAVRYFSLLCGVLGVALVYRLGREWCSRRVGTAAALLMAASPYMVWYSQEAKMYALVCAVATAALCVYRRALTGAGWRTWALVVLLVWVAASTHVMGSLLLPLMGVLFLAWWPLSRRRWRAAVVSLGAAILPAVLLLPWMLSLLAHGADFGHRFMPLPGIAATMMVAFGRGIASAGGLAPVGLALFALLASVILWPDGDLLAWFSSVLYRRQGQRMQGARRCVLPAWSWIAVPIVGLYLITLRVPMFVDRYLIWIGPAVYLLMARGLEQVRRRAGILAHLCLAALLLLNGWAVWQQSAVPIKSDLRGAAAYVRQHRAPDELVMFHISYVRHTFEYYYGDSSPSADGIPTDEQTLPAAVDAGMSERTAGYEVVWLVLSEPEMWDRRGMTVHWLDTHAVAEMCADLARVSVIKYRLPSPSAPGL